MLPNAEEPGLLPKASKLAKAPWDGVWPIRGGIGRCQYRCVSDQLYLPHSNEQVPGALWTIADFLKESRHNGTCPRTLRKPHSARFNGETEIKGYSQYSGSKFKGP